MTDARSLPVPRARRGGSAALPGATADSSGTVPRRVLFVTGRLAEPALRRTLFEMAPPFAYEVAPLKITVAALMTTPWIARFLDAGFAAADVRRMVQTNPVAVLPA